MKPQRVAAAAPIVALLVAVIVVGAVFAYAFLTPRSSTSSSDSSYTSSGRLTAYYNSTISTTSTNSSVNSECSATRTTSPDDYLQFGTVAAGTESPATVCVELYYFSASPESLNLTNPLSIVAEQGTQNGETNSFSGSSNFTVSSSQEEIVMGGAGSQNEGTLVAFSIAAEPGASGTYYLGFAIGGLAAYLLESQEPVICKYYGYIEAGDGQPSYTTYVPPTTCLTISSSYYCDTTTSASSSACETVPGVSYPLVDGNLYFRVISVTNSGQ
ncbi:MAG: hypothetical protein ACRD6W_05155 [Nitrososphaerales archaeon]